MAVCLEAACERWCYWSELNENNVSTLTFMPIVLFPFNDDKKKMWRTSRSAIPVSRKVVNRPLYVLLNFIFRSWIIIGLWLTSAMNLFQHFLIGYAVLSINIYANAQRTFLDDLAFRPTFRRFRELFLNLSKNRSPQEAFRTNIKLGVSWTFVS